MSTEEEYVIEKANMIEKAFAAGKAFAIEKASWLEVNPNWISSVRDRLPTLQTISQLQNIPQLQNLPRLSNLPKLPKWTIIDYPIRQLGQLSPLISSKGRRRPIPLRPTSYLDGLRGFAALLVYILHHELWAHDSLKSDKILENSFGYNRQYYFVSLPFIRTFFSGGHLAVAVFFVISGYVLSAKPLALLREGDLVKLGDNLGSALFRRWLRLYIPIISTTFLYMTLNFMIRGLTARRTESRYFDEVTKWYVELKDFSFVFRMGGEPWFTYNFHVWTIPLEFKGSIVIYTAIMAFARCTRKARLLCNFILIFYFLYIVDGWYCASFVAGMIMCDLDLMIQHNELPQFLTRFDAYQNKISYTILIVGLYLGGVPSNSSDIRDLRANPGWYYLSFMKPEAVFNPKAYYLFWAGICIVHSVPRIPWLKSFFETPFNQNLGRVSYAFYLLHGPILWTIGDRVYAAVGWHRSAHAINIPSWTNVFHLPRFGPLGLEFNFIVANLLIFPLTLWVAKIGTTLFDDPAITFSRWLHKRMTGGPSQPPTISSKPQEELPK